MQQAIGSTHREWRWLARVAIVLLLCAWATTLNADVGEPVAGGAGILRRLSARLSGWALREQTERQNGRGGQWAFVTKWQADAEGNMREVQVERVAADNLTLRVDRMSWVRASGSATPSLTYICAEYLDAQARGKALETIMDGHPDLKASETGRVRRLSGALPSGEMLFVVATEMHIVSVRTSGDELDSDRWRMLARQILEPETERALCKELTNYRDWADRVRIPGKDVRSLETAIFEKMVDVDAQTKRIEVERRLGDGSSAVVDIRLYATAPKAKRAIIAQLADGTARNISVRCAASGNPLELGDICLHATASGTDRAANNVCQAPDVLAFARNNVTVVIRGRPRRAAALGVAVDTWIKTQLVQIEGPLLLRMSPPEQGTAAYVSTGG